MNPFLEAVGLPYRGVNRLRRALYRKGLLHARRLPRPVISVGNVAAGGAGKTPAVITVVRDLTARGLKVAVLTRGYGRRDPSVQGMITSLDAGKYGDEPVLIRSATSCDVIVGSNRYKNGIEYLRNNQCDVFVLDDGFQHLQLHRDFDLVIDAPSRFSREGRSALRHAHAVVPRRLTTSVPDQLRGARAVAFAGLADNRQFFNALREAGVRLENTRGFPDHHRYSLADLEDLRRLADGLPLVTTAKDAVKIGDPAILVAGASFEIDPAVLDSIAAAAQPPAVAERRRKRRKGRLVQRAEYIAYRGVARAVGAMSESGVRRWGTRLGTLMRHVLRSRDALAFRNLKYVYPERPAADLRAILDECWRHFGREALVSIRMQNLEPAEILARVDVVNSRLVDEALSRGTGVVLLSAHWGSWEVAGVTAMSVVPRLRTVARPLDNELLEADLHRLREKLGAEIIDRRRAARALLRGISGNGVVAMIPDQAVQPREGELVPFLRHPAWTTPAPAKLALRANATIVFTFCIPDGLRYRLEFQEVIRTDLLTGEERDPVALTRRINEIFSQRIDSRPELWLWMHDRWKGTQEREPTNAV